MNRAKDVALIVVRVLIRICDLRERYAPARLDAEIGNDSG